MDFALENAEVVYHCFAVRLQFGWWLVAAFHRESEASVSLFRSPVRLTVGRGACGLKDDFSSRNN